MRENELQLRVLMDNHGGDWIGPASDYLEPVGIGYPPGPEGDAQRAKDHAERKAYEARENAWSKLDTALAVIRRFGTAEDTEAATNALAKIAATAMRRRPAK